MSARRLLVIGAGPVGLAAALGGARLGWQVTVLEKGGIGDSIRHWGPILGASLPAADALLTGPEFVDAVLLPLAACPPLAGRVKTGHRVVAVGRAERGFRVLVETPAGEQTMEADAVIDASGTYGQPTSLGAGGIPAPGERALAGRLIRSLGALDERFPALAGRSLLLIGSGHSAANAIARLAALAEESPETRVIWATRSFNRKPCVEVASDPLAERQRIAAGANRLAMDPPAWLTVERRASVNALESVGSKLRVFLSADRQVEVDEIVGLTGYRPDLSILSELTVGIDPATEGAAGLARALSNVTDCLAVPDVSPGDLHSGEPGFCLAGVKSYGRSPAFLLKAGYRQLETILRQLNALAGQ